MEVLQNTTLWLVLLSSICLLAIWRRWTQAHPRCICCRKHIRRAYMHCPWCGLQQFHSRPVRRIQRPHRASQGSFVAQEAAMPPHKRPRTVVLPEMPAQPRRQQRSDWQRETILVPEALVRSRVRICPYCNTEQYDVGQRCQRCGSSLFFWQER